MQAMLMIPGGLFDERCEWLTITDWLTVMCQTLMMMSDNNSIDNEEIRKIRRGSGSNQPSLLNRPASFVDHGLMFQIYFYCVEGHPRRRNFWTISKMMDLDHGEAEDGGWSSSAGQSPWHWRIRMEGQKSTAGLTARATRTSSRRRDIWSARFTPNWWLCNQQCATCSLSTNGRRNRRYGSQQADGSIHRLRLETCGGRTPWQ